MYVSGGDKGEGLTSFVSDLALDASKNTIYAATPFTKRVFSIDIETGDRTIIASESDGFGVVLENPRELAFDAKNNRLLIADNQSTPVIVALNLTTFERTVLSGNGVGVGEDLLEVNALTLMEGTDKLLLATGIFRVAAKLVEIDTLSGDRRVVNSDVLGDLRQIAVDEISGRVFVNTSIPRTIQVVDLVSGNAAVISE